MTPSARVQAAIEILDEVLAAARGGGAPADRVIGDWFRSRRFAGSKDRRAVRELVYRAIRACGPVPASGRAAMVRLALVHEGGDAAVASLFDGGTHAPQPIGQNERAAEGGVAPVWLMALLSQSGLSVEDGEALLGRAPLDIRANTLKADRASLILPEPGEALLAPQGLRLPANTLVEQWDAYTQGQIEIQDAGSQLTCQIVAARAGETVIDLCAGAGGKALALAADMGNVGRLIACDVDRGRLARLAPRAARAGVAVIEEVLMNPGHEAAALAAYAGKADAVLVDAPCSGTGTWRRQPEGRWRLSEKELARLTALQSRLLDVAAGLVAPQGRLIFVTCSVLDAEGADQIAAFLARHPGWRTETPVIGAGVARGGGLRLTPLHDDTDGFFVARLVPVC